MSLPSCANANDDDPTYVYKLIPHTSPVPTTHADLPERLPVSEIDAQSGFIHLSTAHQVPGTLTHFFTTNPRVYILRVRYAPLADAGVVRWETPEGAVCGPRPGEGLFPHVYNGLKLGRDEIESVWVLQRAEGGWEQGMADEGFRAWLVY